MSRTHTNYDLNIETWRFDRARGLLFPDESRDGASLCEDCSFFAGVIIEGGPITTGQNLVCDECQRRVSRLVRETRVTVPTARLEGHAGTEDRRRLTP